MTCWDVALPSDPQEMQFLRESDKYRVYYYSDRAGDTIYQGQFKSCIGHGWLDDNDCHTCDEDVAIDWFENVVNPSEDK